MEADKGVFVVPEPQSRADGLVTAPADECLVPFTSDSLHDLASPINQIGTMAGLLASRYRNQLDEDADVLFGFLDKSTRQLQAFVAGLGRYMQAVGLPGSLRSCDGNALLASALESIRKVIDEHDALITHDALPELYCHPNQVTTVFANLIENSIKFRRDERPEVHVSASVEKDACLLSVRDNGIGISPRQSKRIFSVFTRAHELEAPGAGIGLAVVRRIVENHQGRLWLESEVGRGTTVFFTLPEADCRKICAIA